jgi:predicted ribosomally synthesized peptide with SipW-like signal peptide
MEVNIMYSKKALPVGTMFLVLVIALALLGVGYALWSETLTITGTVQTGEVDVEFSQYPAEECIDIQGVLTCPEPPEKAAAANCTVAWSNTATDPNDNGANLLEVTVTGMYPSYHCKVGFDVTSTGNVPVHVWLPEPAGDIPAWVATNFENCYDDGVQLHQGESTGKCTVDIHFTNDTAPEENSGPYTFGWTILATQFNENPAPPLDITTVTSSVLNFSSTGAGGWSCPSTHPQVLSAYLQDAGTDGDPNVAPHTLYLWVPGATTGTVTYPNTPFGYTYGTGETGAIVLNGGTPQSAQIVLTCQEAP